MGEDGGGEEQVAGPASWSPHSSDVDRLCTGILAQNQIRAFKSNLIEQVICVQPSYLNSITAWLGWVVPVVLTRRLTYSPENEPKYMDNIFMLRGCCTASRWRRHAARLVDEYLSS
jgi:hypothetical protein